MTFTVEMEGDQRWEIHYQEGTITAKVKKADPEWWPMFYYIVIVHDSSTNKEVSKVIVSRDEIQPAIDNLMEFMA